MRLKITQKNLTSPYDNPMDVSTIRALLVNHLNWDEFEQARYLYNPRCPKQKARDKALKTLQKDYDKKTKRERNRDRNALDKLPFGKVIGAEVSFHKVAFTNVTKFLIDNKIPFEITSYDMTYREDMQWEIDEEKRIDDENRRIKEWEKKFDEEQKKKEDELIKKFYSDKEEAETNTSENSEKTSEDHKNNNDLKEDEKNS